jgi:predicted outer membrane protein
MSVPIRPNYLAVAATIACIFAGNTLAQQGAIQGGTPAGEGTSDRAGIEQNERSGSQNNRSPRDAATRQQRNQVRTAQSSQTGQNSTQVQAGGQTQDVERYLASCLLAKNQAEIELAQFAQQQAQNPEVQQFAQQMIQDHQQIVQQLQQVAGQQGGRTEQRTSTNTSQSRDASSQNGAQRQTDDTARLPGSSGAGQSESRNALGSSTSLQTESQSRSLTALGSSQDRTAFEQLIQIDRQIVEREGQAVREELQQKQGAEFDKAFMGTAVHAHVHMLAALETIEQQGQGQLAQVVQQARPMVQQHLDHAKQLKQQLDGARPSAGGQAERRAQSESGQRQ